MSGILIGGESFREIREKNFFFVDKTAFIEEFFLNSHAKVSLITRPRRFGKTLLQDMLCEFFDIRKDSRNIFDGLDVSKNSALCASWMNKYPTICISLKEFSGASFQEAVNTFRSVLSGYLIQEFSFLLDSQEIEAEDKNKIRRIRSEEAGTEQIGDFFSLLMRCLKMHYKKNVIVLIDEYDVPLAKAHENGYYDEMVEFIRSMLGRSLKTNRNLEFAILTGCLRISKESIFTGLNNFVCYTISGYHFMDKFGFTQNEVDSLLSLVNFSDKKDIIQEWYDGYIFGNNQKVYCPWDVLLYVTDLMKTSEAVPMNYWVNTSENSIIRDFLDNTNFNIKNKCEKLISGGYIPVTIDESLTYNSLYTYEDNIWTLLYLSGYLTKSSKNQLGEHDLKYFENQVNLVIPNREIRSIFISSCNEWFKRYMSRSNRKILFNAFWDGDTAKFHEQLTSALKKSISYFDYKEDFYHAFLAGIFFGSGYTVLSNREGGTGRMDIQVVDENNSWISVIEVKHTDVMEKIQEKAEEGLSQIEKKEYDTAFHDFKRIIRWGTAFCKKNCAVACQILG